MAKQVIFGDHSRYCAEVWKSDMLDEPSYFVWDAEDMDEDDLRTCVVQCLKGEEALFITHCIEMCGAKPHEVEKLQKLVGVST